jgi:hypothetical protein
VNVKIYDNKNSRVVESKDCTAFHLNFLNGGLFAVSYTRTDNKSMEVLYTYKKEFEIEDNLTEFSKHSE